MPSAIAQRARTLLLLALLLLFCSPAQGHTVIVGSCDLPGYVTGIDVSGSNAYMAHGSHLEVIDISNPESPFQKNFYPIQGDAMDLTLSGNYAYLAASYGGLQIFDISNQASIPILKSTGYTQDHALSVALSGSYAIVAAYYSGLEIFDVSDPGRALKAGEYDPEEVAWDVAASGGYAYMATYSNGIQIVDISNPTAPFKKGACDTPGYAYGVAVSGDYAYVADYDRGLQIIDISNPASPTIKGTCDVPGHAVDVVVSGSYAYVADYDHGLQIIDISNPESPTIADTCDTPGNAYDVAVSGGYIYVADYDRGLQILGNGPTIKGRAWSDANLNGIQDSGEQGLQGVTVSLLDSSDNPVLENSLPVTTQTDSSGSYQFEVVAGSYKVKFEKSGYSFSPKDAGGDDSKDSDVNATTGKSDLIDASPGTTYTIDAGLRSTQAITGTVFDDKNANGKRDSGVDQEGEPVLPGRTVRLKDSSGNQIASTTTDSMGFFSFIQPPGTYILTEDIPSGRLMTGISLSGATNIKYGSGSIFDHSSFQEGDVAAKFDLVIGTPIDAYLGDCKSGSFTVTEYSCPSGSGQAFSFTSSKGTPSSFSLSNGQSQSFLNAFAGTYTIQEMGVPEGWGLVDISCTGTGVSAINYSSDGTNWHSSYQNGDDRSRFNLGVGGSVSLSFKNSQTNITVTKSATPSSSQSFTFKSPGLSGGSDFTLSGDGSGTRTFSGLKPGDYIIQEMDLPTGWVLSSIASIGEGTVRYSKDGKSWHDVYKSGDDRANVTLSAGQSSTVTFSDYKLNSINLTNSAHPKSDLDFTFSSAGLNGGTDFTLSGDGTAAGIRLFSSLASGDYIIQEKSVPKGWAINNIASTGVGTARYSSDGAIWHECYKSGDDRINVTLTAGQAGNITFTNCELNSVSITKSADPSSGQEFTFGSDELNGGLDFTLKGDGTSAETVTFGDLASGDYTVQEKDLPAGWGIANINSSGTASANFSSDGTDWHGSYQSGDDRVRVTLGSGQSSYVTFSDSQTRITVSKSASPKSGQEFTFGSDELNGGSDFTLKGDGTGMRTFADLASGEYIIQEKSVPEGWAISNISSTGTGTVLYSSDGSTWHKEYQSGDDRVDIELEAGQSTNITFEDCQLNSISITKSADPSSGQEFTFGSDELNGGLDFTLKGDGTSAETVTFGNLASGDYTVQEKDLPAGWGIANINSSGTASANFSSDGTDWHGSYQSGDDRVRVTLGSGQSSYVTFSDSQTRITVVKSASPKSDEEFTFGSDELNDGLDFTLKGDGSGTRTFADLAAGDYIIHETSLPPNWQISNIESNGTANITFSSNEVDWHDLYQSGDDRAMVTIADGQSATVTFFDSQTNSSSGLSISGRKFEDLDGNGAMDEGDPFLDGWTVSLYNTTGLLAESITSDGGWYSFSNLSNGTYEVSEELRDGWVQTYPGQGTHIIDLDSDFEDADFEDAHFGNTPLANISLKAYLDKPVATPTDHLILSLELSNQGKIEISNVSLALDLPKGLRFVQSSTEPDQVFSNSNGSATLIWQNLAPLLEQSMARDLKVEPLKDQSSEREQIAEVLNVEILADGSRMGEIQAAARAYAMAINGLNASSEASASVSIVPSLLVVSKTADVSSATMGDNITYTIKVCNPTGQELEDIAVKDVFNRDVEMISASPEFDRDGLWHINLGPGECAVMALVVRVPKYDIRFDSGSGVSGHGYVNVHNDFRAAPGPYVLKNCVYVSGDGIGNVSACADVAVGIDDGTELAKREHGSGSYDEDEQSRLRLENRSIQVRTSLSADHNPTVFALPNGRSLRYRSLWGTDLTTRNRLTGASMSESYRYASSIEKESYVDLDKNASTLWTDARFEGQGHLGFNDLPRTDRTAIPIIEAREDYAGTFSINGSIDAYGSSVISNRSASGTGLVYNDKRVRNSQRTYEYGTGSYQSEEEIRTPESYMTKDVKAAYSPVIYLPGKSAGTRWGEGIWSQSKGISFLGSQISSANYIEKEAIAAGLSDLKTSENFSGRGSIKAVLKQEIEGKEADKVRFEEEYVGKYSLKRKIHLTGVSTYDEPHLYITKEGWLSTDPLKYNYTAARYVITVLNDGNAALGPVYVRDVFPAGSEYINSSIRPSQLASGYANWTFVYLPIGQTLRIELNLLVGDDSGDLVNVAYASGGYDGQWVSSGNFSALERSWLSCCSPEISACKTAYIDPSSPELIWYRISVENRGRYGMVARVTDILPSGLMFINSTIEPEGRYNLSWIIPEIAPGTTGVVDYLAVARSSGRYVNRAHIEAHALDGSGRSEADVSSAVVVTEETPASHDYVSDASGWKPPDWGLDLSDNICGGNESCALYSSCPSCKSIGDIP